MKRVFFLVVLLQLAVSVLFAQNDVNAGTSPIVPPAPVVSGLTAACEGNTVTLTWNQAPDIDGESLIFRANSPITASNYYAADKRGSVPFSTLTFSETIDDGQEYYYAVLSQDSLGNLYEFFLPVSNSLLVGVSTGSVREMPEASVFTSFDAITRNDAVIITWKASTKNKNMVIYRSTSPFTGMTSLVQAIVVTGFNDTGTPYVDYPVPGVPYYYAILDEDAIRSGTVTFAAGENTNKIPVEIPSSFARIQRSNLPGLRPMPLPFLNPSRTVTVAPWRFSPETEKIILAVGGRSGAKKAPDRAPYLFLSDIEAVSSGEEYSLKKILDDTFVSQDWKGTISALTQLLAIRRTEMTAARIHFYLGEAHYFTGNYHQALLEFLLAQDQYYNQSREWIQYVLEKMI